MQSKKYMTGVIGEISQVFSNESAEVRFDVQGTVELALLKKTRYYHDGRLLPDGVSLANYIRKDMQVQFSCHVLDRQESEGMDFYHQTKYRWFIVVCWPHKKPPRGDSPKREVTITTGMVSVPGMISAVTNRHGIITTEDPQDERSVAFLASKVYLHGKRFPSSKMLSTQLNIDDLIFFDAIPCIPEEDKDGCQYFASCVFLGKRPPQARPADIFSNDSNSNGLPRSLLKSNDAATDGDTNGGRKNKVARQIQTNVKSQLLKMINVHTNNSRTLFSSGYGYIFDILNDEFGVIIGCFKTNVFQTILFHRKNAFLFKTCLARAKLTEIFVEGDRMRFVAVGAPADFITDWIAVQVGVADS